MNPQRVLLVRNTSLINDVLLVLLVAGPALEVVLSDAGNNQDLDDDITRVGPDVVLLVEGTPLADEETLTHLMTARTNLRVIIISPNHNWLRVFRKEDVLLADSVDLLDVINAI